MHKLCGGKVPTFHLDIKDEKAEKCHYCEEAAKYDDTIESDQQYFVTGVCEKHAFKGLVS